MPRYQHPLNQIKVASPCPTDWEKMQGDDRVRFCQQCELKVYNLSAMTRQAATDLVTKTEGRLCVKFYQRKDGTVITDNCPVGLRRIRQRVVRWAGAALTVILWMTSGIENVSATAAQKFRGKAKQQSCQVKKKRKAKNRWQRVHVMGAIAPVMTPVPIMQPIDNPPPLSTPLIRESDQPPPPLPKKQ